MLQRYVHINCEWLEAMVAGKKDREYRKNNRYWQTRLFNPKKRYDFIKFQGGYRPRCPSAVFKVRKISEVPVESVPPGITPPVHTDAFKELVGDTPTVICIELEQPCLKNETAWEPPAAGLQQPTPEAGLQRPTPEAQVPAASVDDAGWQLALAMAAAGI